MAYLLSDFQAAMESAIAGFPAAATAYKAGDPRLIAQIQACAAMLAMLSQQVDVAEAEPFLKARAGTVLADAALKGILPLATPARVQVAVANPSGSAVTLAAGRVILDGKGRSYSVLASATIAAAGSGVITAQQYTTRQISHTVGVSAPFYEVQVTASSDGAYLAGLTVSDASGEFTYSTEFANVASGARVYHAETDEYRRLFLRFGASGIVGHQPASGDVLTITVRECAGEIDIAEGDSFALAYTADAAEGACTLTLDELLASGSAPHDIDTLRVLARYPALHDANAVHLGNFDFLLRRHLPSGLEFLSVWNEQAEEAVRGANSSNINKLFVAVSVPGQSSGTTQAQVSQIVARADDSYRLAFVAPVEVAVPITVTAQVAAVHDPGDIASQIETVLLGLYGRGTAAAARGLSRTFRIQTIHTELRDSIAALQDQISDFSVVVGSTPSPLPEHFRFLTSASVTVNVTAIQDSTGLWSM